QHLDMSRWSHLVTGWEMDSVHVGSLSGMRYRRMQQAARRTSRRKQGQSEDRGPLAVSSLDHVEGRQAHSYLRRILGNRDITRSDARRLGHAAFHPWRPNGLRVLARLKGTRVRRQYR